ncbi:MAG: hypothetical protein E7497_03845 [Ruminococcus sp.]|nr:hypothetical protein [Ruminococcus sp.]
MGYFIYSLLEIVGRGYTHWTMALTGGIVLAALYVINSRRTMTLIKSCFIGSVLITVLELIVGIFDNIIMGWNVWDYTDMPLNVLGQICLPFSGLWFLLCIPAYYLCRAIRIQFGFHRNEDISDVKGTHHLL